MKTTHKPAPHSRRVRTVFALGALAIAVTACGGGDPAPTPEFTRLCASGAEVSNGQCTRTDAFPSNAPACTRDNLTGLVWEARASLAELSSPNAPVGLCGLDNWRVPTVYELLTLDHKGNGNAGDIDRAFFPDLNGGNRVLATKEIYQEGNGELWVVRFNGLMFAGAAAADEAHPVRWVTGLSPAAALNVQNPELTTAYRESNLAALDPAVVQRDPLTWLILASGSFRTFAEVTSDLSAINQLRPGDTNWRLPTRLELDSLVNRTKFEPATDDNIKSLIKATTYWSSSSAADGRAWVVDFNYGDISVQPKSSSAHAIYVRR